MNLLVSGVVCGGSVEVRMGREVRYCCATLMAFCDSTRSEPVTIIFLTPAARARWTTESRSF